MPRIAYADGQPKGEVYADKHGNWVWLRCPGKETYPRKLYKLADVAAHIARLCRAKSVEFRNEL